MKRTFYRWFGSMIPSFALLTSCLVAGAAEETPTTAFEKECHGLAMYLERDLAAKDTGAFEKYFDVEAIIERALDGLDAPAGLEKNFRAAARSTTFDPLARTLSNASGVRYLRMRREGKEATFLFRVLPREGGLNYLELSFENSRRSGLKVVDLRNYAQGQKLSQTLRQNFLASCGDADSFWLGRLDKQDAMWAARARDFDTMKGFNAAGRYAETLRLYSKLPDSFQKEKPCLILQMQAAVQADQRAFQAAVDLWRGASPGDPAVELAAANCRLGRRQLDLAFADLERLDKALGGDAYLDVWRGLQYKNQSKYDDARTWARKATARNPKLHEGWELLISVGLATRDYADIAQVLTEWESKTGVDPARMARSDKLYDFARSPAGQRWLADRPTKTASSPATSPMAAPAPKTATATPLPTGPHKLQGIFYTGSNPSAIISGQTVFTGDRVKGGYRVEKISQQSVTLKSPEGQLLELALK